MRCFPILRSAMSVVVAFAGLLIAHLAVAQDAQDHWRAGPISPLPDMVLDLPDTDPRKVHLGELMFHDPRLSADNTISCASCHDLDNGGVDGLEKAIGIGGAHGTINTPTVFNSAYNFTQFWDGRAESLEEQASGPIHNPAEMGSNWKQVLTKLNRDKNIKAAFLALYSDGITSDNIVDAIATFERTLVTIDAPFDRYLKGDTSAISLQAAHGYDLFQSYGCAACHQGVSVGGNMYQAMGAMGDYFGDRGDVNISDLGRYRITGREKDRHVFKVPSLRVVSRTAPYFHDGSAQTLKDAVRYMAKYQLGRDMPEDDLNAIVAFLQSLAGKYVRFDLR